MVFLLACFGRCIIVGVHRHSQPLNTVDFTSSMIVVKRACELCPRATFLVHYA